jgi:hypothetical protein
MNVYPEEIVRYRMISYCHYCAIEGGTSNPTINSANEILYGLNSLLTEERMQKLWDAGLLPARQKRLYLLDLGLTIVQRHQRKSE